MLKQFGEKYGFGVDVINEINIKTNIKKSIFLMKTS